ncbi:MAG TPA: SUMF1/EgtB/PvdO family nonheme iron enzyme [Pirellulaceae bacterium]|jgi:formylglycine-generating enzyme required for sulfatase activity|nr:SUMF1/EgtB/PvdO family nonheme iron enzyme [Pirellulaceae bacterium]
MARTQAFDWFSTFLLAALILLVPILFVVWVNPGLLDRLQEEFVQRPSAGPRVAPISPATPDADATPDRARDEDAPERSLPSKDDYISAPRDADRRAAIVETEPEGGGTRTAAKPVAIVETQPGPEASGVFDASPAAKDPSSGPAAVPGSGPASGAAGSGPQAANAEVAEPAPRPAADRVEPTERNPSAAPLSTAPGALAVPPLISPTPPDVDRDGDGGGLRPIDDRPVTGSPTPAAPPLSPIEGVTTPPGPADADAAMHGSAPPDSAAGTSAAPTPNSAPALRGVEGAAPASLSDEQRHEEILREIRSLATAQRSLEDQFSALRQDIDGRLSVLKSAVDGVATNGSAGPDSASPEPAAERAIAGAAGAGASAAEEARADRAARILRGTLDGKLTLGLGDEGGTTVDFVYVPPGRFRMGRTAAESQAAVAESVAAPAQEILVDRGFFISKHEVSDEQFVAFLRANYGDDPKLDSVIGARNDLDRPAANVSWALAKYFCLWVSEESAFDVRLPTEVEWEYAARGPYGVVRPVPLADEAAAGTAAASSQKPRDIGEDPSDRSWCGAFDMLGNVAEWCADVYDADAYSADAAGGAKVYSPVPAPVGWAAVEAAGRSVRGGSFADAVETRDLSERRQAKPGVASPTLGFRVVLVPDFDGEVEVGKAP